jgi:hypothetical protein
MVGMDGKSFGQIIIYRANVFSVLMEVVLFPWHSGWDH